MGVIEAGNWDIGVSLRTRKVLEEILANIRLAYLDAGIVHGDLSEYNVIVQPDMHMLIIDWPQFVKSDHPNAQELLLRDVKNVTDYFMRKFRFKVDAEKANNYVLGKTEKLVF
jgi:RIO kinase 2